VSKPELQPAAHDLSAILPKTEYFEIDSAIAGVRYGVWVAVPWTYEFEPERRFPAIFTPDGNLLAPALMPISVDMQNPPGQPFVQVSVGYCGEELADWLFVSRNRDLLPPGEPADPAHLESNRAAMEAGGEVAVWARKFHDAIINGGRADLFLRFLTDELHPLILERYRVEPAMCGLFGHSYGGLFAAWAALQRPAVFPRVGSASVGMMGPGSKVFEVLQQEIDSGADHSGRHLHLSIGEWEMTQRSTYQGLGAMFAKLNFILGNTPLKGLTVTSKIIADEKHATSLPGQFSSFIRACYSVG
jgi:predicted alpha/beta superfamily hydrolase